VFGYDECRSKVLLEYFGETDVPPCGRCDVCRSKHYSPELLEVDPAEAIRRLAAEPDGIDIDELSRVLRIKRETLTRLLRNMVDLDEVIIIGTRVYEPVD
jgi:ATP-dependent DNA helicase RecQ